MKKLTKIFTLCAAFLLVFSLFAFTVSASDIVSESTYVKAESTAPEGEDTPTAESEEITPPKEEAQEDRENNDDGETENVFAAVYNTLIENSDKIFSTLAFIASLIIAFLYKKNFMPTVKNSIGSITAALSEFSTESGKKIGNASALIDAVNSRLLETENMLSHLSDNLSGLEEALKDKTKDTSRLESIKKVISAEVDMLYEIFMTSSLPQYKKEEVGEKISAMKKELSCEVCEND